MRIANAVGLILLLSASIATGQGDGGMLCGGEDEKPLWVLRFEVIDNDTHLPIPHVRIKTMDDKGRTMSWNADSDGIAVLVVTRSDCFPYEGTLEVAADGYQYHSESIERDYFADNESRRRLYLEGHNHWWTNMRLIPETEELIDKLRARRYEVGVGGKSSGLGFNWSNSAPACFEFSIELERLPGHTSRSRRAQPKDHGDVDSYSGPGVPTIAHAGMTIYIFPNDLSGSGYLWSKANAACECLERLGYDDWRLPTKDELHVLYLNKERIGRFSAGWYWSSSETTQNRSWAQSFDDGDQDAQYKGTLYNIHKGSMKVRCIRTEQRPHDQGDRRGAHSQPEKTEDETDEYLRPADEGSQGLTQLTDDYLASTSSQRSRAGSWERSSSENNAATGSGVGSVGRGSQESTRRTRVNPDRVNASSEVDSRQSMSAAGGNTAAKAAAADNRSGIAVRKIGKALREKIKKSMNWVAAMYGVQVAYLEETSPAFQAGLREGMIISSIKVGSMNRTPFHAEDFDKLMEQRSNGERIRMTVWRQSEGNSIKPGYAGSEQRGKWYREEIQFLF